MNKVYLLSLVLLITFPVFAESNLIKDEDLIKSYLSQKAFKIDTAANAIYLDEYGKIIASYSERNFYYEFKVQKLAKIINAKGIDIANVRIDLQPNQEIVNIEAITYRLNNKKELVGIEAEHSYQSFKKQNLDYVILNFKDVKAGNIIYYKYTLKSSGNIVLPTWNIKNKYPKLHSKLEVASEFGVEFAVYSNTKLPFTHSSFKDLENCESCRYHDANINSMQQFRTAVWSRNNIQGAKRAFGIYPLEPQEYLKVQLNNLQNLKAQRNANNNSYGSMSRSAEYIADIHLNSWAEVNDKLLFGNPKFLSRITSKIITEKVKAIVGNTDDDLEKARKIFSFVRDSISLVENNVPIFSSGVINEVFENREGNSSEKNLLLNYMLNLSKLKADPVVLIKGRDEILRHDFPNYSSLNHCIVSFSDGSTRYFLDASAAGIPFGVLSSGCYNKISLLIKKATEFIVLPAAPKEQSLTLVTMKKTAGADSMDVTLQVKLSKFSSMGLRNYLFKGKTPVEAPILVKNVSEYLGINPDFLKDCNMEQLYHIDSAITLNCRGLYSSSSLFNENGFNPFIIKITDPGNQMVNKERGEPRESVYMFNLYLPGEHKIVTFPETKNIALSGNAITYVSHSEYNPEDKLFKLTYTYKDNGDSFDGFQGSDLSPFFKAIESNQSERVYAH